MAYNKVFIGNWKVSPKTEKEVEKLLKSIKSIKHPTNNLITICPSFVHLSIAADLLSRSRVVLGAQDVSAYGGTANTGEVSAEMLEDFGVSFVIVGHSERKAMGESNEKILRKIKSALSHKITPIVCIGEHEKATDGSALREINEQMVSLYENLTEREAKQTMIAYEPIWAIGDEAVSTPTPHEIHETVLFIRKIINEMYNRSMAFSIKILYGGSVNETNAKELFVNSDINGFIIGRASTDPSKLSEIIKQVNSK
ncbi:MAG: triose-phosphate isomerase [Candidatus Campbellbacteria bacterium]|nr:triose-phosphate isomerase [Candidatus Campbellbacteria bacterium]